VIGCMLSIHWDSIRSTTTKKKEKVGFYALEDPILLQVIIRTNVHFLPRPCILRCLLQCRRSPISLNHWPVLPVLKPPSWDTRY
jgi:hypothetical protein